MSNNIFVSVFVYFLEYQRGYHSRWIQRSIFLPGMKKSLSVLNQCSLYNKKSAVDILYAIYTQVTVDPNIPAKFRGVLQRVSIQLKPEFFDRLPGMNDPTGTAFQAQQVCWRLMVH